MQNHIENNNEKSLSDKYEDQFERLNNALVALFQYQSLLNNEYLIRKFEIDPFTGIYVLPYEVVQRENSIKCQYVQNERNTRKQYHLILTKILNDYNGKLWNYDSQMLLIRPFFGCERKRVYIKLLEEHVENIKTIIKAITCGILYSLDVQNYAADGKYKKVYLTLPTEQYAQNIFSQLLANKKMHLIESIMMEEIDYLGEFHQLVHQKKSDLYLSQHQQSQKLISGVGQERPYKGNREYQFEEYYPRQGPRNYKARNQLRVEKGYQYVEKQEEQNNFALVRKSLMSKTLKQQKKKNEEINGNDFPTLEDSPKK